MSRSRGRPIQRRSSGRPTNNFDAWSGLVTPIGILQIRCDRHGRLLETRWGRGRSPPRSASTMLIGPGQRDGPRSPHHPVDRALYRYFQGDVTSLDRIPVVLHGTEFQLRVWTALRSILAGRTLSYSTLARRLGCPAATRAVGGANAANPASVVVPCHRLIGSNGSLVGYGGGLDRKRWLLQHELRHAHDGSGSSWSTPRQDRRTARGKR
ncbi:MAG: methylated-DNA--[protein]-cysteine S-methyltransferase [Thermoplasmata archaeon]